MGVLLRHEECLSCGSSDAKAVYQNEDESENSHCFSCGKTSVSNEYIESKNAKSKSVRSTKEKSMSDTSEVKSTKIKPVITPEAAQEVKDSTTYKSAGFRGITDETSKFFGIRYSCSEDTGEVEEQYYPCTQEGQLTGYKIRSVPKDFRSIGRTGADCELFGQFRFNRGGKYVIITEGELCQLSAYQMLKEYNTERGSDYEIAVVSPTTGAQSQRQIAAQYKFFDSFAVIVCAFDSDKAGQAAQAEILKVLPKGKVKTMQLRYKDHNEYLENAKNKEFVQDFYNAKLHVPAGVVGSSQLYEKMLENAYVEKVPFPAFMSKLDNLIGSIELGTIGVFAAGSGSAKTTVANELLYYWLFNSPHKIGVVSLELTCAQYGQAMLSRHIEKKISLIKDPAEKVKFLEQERIREKGKELFLDANGNDRFMVIDERDGSIDVLQDKIEELVISCGCKVLILDPLSDIMDSLSIDEQAKFMKWCKSIIKTYNVTFLMIAHIRKASSNKDAASTGAFTPEEGISGSSTIVKSASWVVMMMRDKYNTDPVVRNTTRLVLSKNRAGGETGEAGQLYYCNQTHTLHDLEEWQKENGVESF